MTANYSILSLWINGRELSLGGTRTSEPVFNPATGEVLAELPHATDSDLDEAVAAASRAFKVWRAVSPFERGNILRRAAGLIRERAGRIATIMTLEQGKPIDESKGEITHAAELFDWYAEEGRRAYGRIVSGRSENLDHFVVSEPVGPCAAFTPWNFPALTPARKLSGALAAGCSIILKASEETPGCAVELVRALHDAGLPPGCAQLVFGVPSDISKNLIARPEIRKISFTGSTAVGIHLMKLAADGVKRVTMELGGNSPVLIFDDADYDATLQILAVGKRRNAGQVCVSPGRFFVHESLYERFTGDLAKLFSSMVVANGLQPGVEMGPLANVRRMDAMQRFVEDAQKGGARVVTGGRPLGNVGNFFAPTIVTDLSEDALLLNEECFGPIAPVVPFVHDDDAIQRANAVDAGLAGYAFTTSPKRIRHIGRAIKTGMVGINSLVVSTPETPFGGVKASGFGSEGGIEGLQAYSETKLITVG
ncbi:MAG TPA: NAD-dependent succinate-semialdehyde dehydrogenase [Terriglobales bacterium]